MTSTRCIFQAAGSPDLETDATGTCRTCGHEDKGSCFESWVRPTFTDWDKLTGGDIICSACQFCFDDSNQTLDSKIGKPRQRMRNYSHFVVRGEWHPLSKGQKTEMHRLLLDPQTSVAVIAASGQKHIIFRSLPDWWQFEELRVRPEPARLSEAMSAIQPLYDGGFAKSELASGRYSQRRILEFGMEPWRRLDQTIRRFRGSPVFDLALFLAQRTGDEIE